MPPKKYVSGGKERCFLCPARHRLIYYDEYKAKPIKERKRIVFDQQLCFNCLKSTHSVNECPSDNRCWKSGCGQKHHSLLHEDAELKPTQQMDRQHTEGDGSRSNVNQVKVQPFKRVALQILPVKVRGSNATISTYAVLDAGSDSTLIRKDLADELQLDGDMHQLELTTVGSDPTSNEFKCVSFELSSDSHPTPISVDGAWVISNMDIPVFQYSKERASSRWKHLEGIDLPDLRGDDVKLLIGSDMAHLLLHLDTRMGRQDEPIAVKTQLGWTLFGSISYKHGKRLHLNTASISQGDTIHQSLERFWEMDSYGTIPSQPDLGCSVDDRQAVEILERTTKKVDGHFETGLLWRDENIVLPNNRCMAVSRLHSTERKLMKHPQLAQKYQDVLDEYVAKEHCKKLSPQKAQRTSSKTWYLPHHAVFNINKPGKVRVVFDAAAKFDDISLNDCLLTGPDLLNNLGWDTHEIPLGKDRRHGRRRKDVQSSWSHRR